MNLLFICTYNQYRSPTAEHIFKSVSGIKVKSAGTSGSATHHVNSTDLKWADIVFVMEKKHKEYLEENFEDEMKNKKIVNLNIPDEYKYMDPELVQMLETEVSAHLHS